MHKPVIAMLLVLLLVSCQPNQTSTPIVPTGESGPHFLLSTTSLVQLNRDGWSDYSPIAFGTVLYPTDLLKTDNEVRVLCVGKALQVQSIPAGEHRVPCPPEVGILIYKGALFREIRGIDGDKIPFTLYPRNTLLLDDMPTLRWNDTGASNYTVSLTQGGQTIWTKESVEGDSLTYPTDESPLESGKHYRFVVIYNDNDSQYSSEDGEPAGTGFRLATDEEKAEIEAGRERIVSVSKLVGPDRDFALAAYYAGLEISPERGFSSPLGEAWLLLDRLAEAHNAPAIHLWYGDVLTRLKLPDEAEKVYQNAINQAQQLGDLESQGVGHLRLWCITNEKDHFNDALQLFQELGDLAQVEIINQGKENRDLVCR